MCRFQLIPAPANTPLAPCHVSPNVAFTGEVSSVEIELQADCLAGAWANSADKRGMVEVGDVDEALNAASQIGDDTIQKKTTGHVQPETFTHGSAAQRSAAFRRGYQGGATACGIR